MGPPRVLLGAATALAAGLIIRCARWDRRMPRSLLHLPRRRYRRLPPPPAASPSHLPLTPAPHCRRLSPGYKLNRLLNRNLHLFSGPQRTQLRQLAASGSQAHLLRNWPSPGVRDGAKRALVAKAAAGAPSGELEAARLGERAQHACERRCRAHGRLWRQPCRSLRPRPATALCPLFSPPRHQNRAARGAGGAQAGAAAGAPRGREGGRLLLASLSACSCMLCWC